MYQNKDDQQEAEPGNHGRFEQFRRLWGAVGGGNGNAEAITLTPYSDGRNRERVAVVRILTCALLCGTRSYLVHLWRVRRELMA
ncbi:MAG: hypothetical protein DMF84_30540 [Acidobacteria bacterium]|nr:MAG: hypothetical protein DMF84_30540 [Acidobacteriota bacterium]